MIVIEKNEGVKIPYSVKGTKITFDDELTLNLERYERDDANHLDVCRDKYGNLICGVIPGVAENYVAQVDIPARSYIEIMNDQPQEEPQDDAEGQTAGNMGGGSTREPAPFDMNKCTLTVWAV